MPYNRYTKFTTNGTTLNVPFVKIPNKSSDIFVYYEEGVTRMDLLSYQYYNDAGYGWLILQANPSLSSMEYDIPNGTKIRIPFPLDTTIIQYENAVDEYSSLYGLK
jgi:phage tail protein X